MNLDGPHWVEELSAGLAAQRALLHNLLAFCQDDPDIRWLVIGCSLARGVADTLSDIDAALGVDDEQLAAALPRIRRAVDGLGELIDSYHHKLPSLDMPHERIFAQYADRTQMDLVAYLASTPAGSIPDAVVLYDPSHLLVVPEPTPPAPVTAEQVRERAFQGWCALADAGKYLRRSSPWEALDRLNEARAQFWYLWAAARHVLNPQYGLTSILDHTPAHLPPGIERTVSDLDPGRLLAAARELADLLNILGTQFSDDQRAALPAAMARYVISDLAAIRVDDDQQSR
jgi:hypothetical protein